MPYAILILVLIPGFLSAQAISVFNANSVADIIETTSAKINSFKGTFVYKKDRSSFSGVVTYVSPDKLLMQFGTEANPQDKKIVSDGQFIWVQEGNIIARQKMTDTGNPVSAWNIRKLRRQYIPTAPGSGLEIMFGNTPAYQIILEPKVNTTSFRNIDIIADREGLIRRIRGVSRVGTVTELTFHYQEFNKEYNSKSFVVTTTEDSQIYDNIFE
ncbi:MAG: LolA family protein [Brevinema sp.]